MYPFLRLLVALVVLALPARAAAQDPPRPELPPGADRNDWEAYYDLGVSLFRNSPVAADAAFRWSSRLDPERAEPLFGRWAAFWVRNHGRWEGYLEARRQVVESPDVIRSDSLQYRAMVRNPFVHRGLQVVLYDLMPGRWRQDARTRGLLAYANGDLPQAAEQFRRAVATDPERSLWARYERALALTAQGKFDDAVAEMTALSEALRRRDRERTVRVYESKEMVEYGIGLLHAARGDLRAAQEAQERAVLENIGFAPGHAALGLLAYERRDYAAAVQAYAQALELDGGDAVVRHRHAAALAASANLAGAERELRAVLAAEPYYAAPYALLGRVLEAGRRPAEARAAYERFLSLARRKDPQLAAIRARIAALGATP